MDKADLKALGRRVAGARNGVERYRGTAGLENFATDLGKSYWTVRGYEAGRSDIPRDVLLKISELTGKPIEWLVGTGDEPDQAAVSIAGVPVSGPADKLAAIVAALDAQKAREPDLSKDPAIVNRLRPNDRHKGALDLLDIVDRGEFEARFKFALEPPEEIALRTVGRSGKAIETVEEAMGLVLRWRGERLGQAPDLAGPEPGVLLLLENDGLVAALDITDQEQDALRRARCGGLVTTTDAAILLLRALRAGVERARQEPQDTDD